MFRLLVFAAVLSATLLGWGVAQSEQQTSGAAVGYINHALDIMQQNSLHRKVVDWRQLRRETLERAEGSQTAADTYDAIRFALGKLGDHHSFLQLSPDMQTTEKEARAKYKVLPTPETGPEKWPPSPYIYRHIPGGSIEKIDGIRVARIVVPHLINPDDGQMRSYAEVLGSTIANLATEHPTGWIIDLRGNLGGNMWPMLAGVGPLEGTGGLGSYIDADGNEDTWFYGADGAGVHTHHGKRHILCWIRAQPIFFKTPQIVAILIDHGTASSGEAIAISFQGMPRSRSFGRPTHGQSTANEGFPLKDGANLVLTTSVEADRTGKVYLDGIIPEVVLPEETQMPAPGSIDPMSQVAAAWIKSTAERH